MPNRHAARGKVAVPAERAFVGLFLLLVGIKVVSQKPLGQLEVHLAFRLLQELFPTLPTGIR